MRVPELQNCISACKKEDKREDWRDNNYEELREDYLEDTKTLKCPRFPCSDCLSKLPLKAKKIKWIQWKQSCYPKGTSEDC